MAGGGAVGAVKSLRKGGIIKPKNRHGCIGEDYVMKSYAFELKVNPDGQLDVPDELLQLLHGNVPMRVITLVDDETDAAEEADWKRLSLEKFFVDYSDADAIYDTI